MYQHQIAILDMHERLPHTNSLTIKLWIYKQIHRIFNAYMTHLPSFISFCGLVHAYKHNQFGSSLAIKIIISFSFITYFHRPSLDNMDVYTSTLILCNSLIYIISNTKLDTMVHLLIFYHPSKLYGVLIANM